MQIKYEASHRTYIRQGNFFYRAQWHNCSDPHYQIREECSTPRTGFSSPAGVTVLVTRGRGVYVGSIIVQRSERHWRPWKEVPSHLNSFNGKGAGPQGLEQKNLYVLSASTSPMKASTASKVGGGGITRQLRDMLISTPTFRQLSLAHLL